MNHKKLKEVLDMHKKWIIGEDGGVRANLHDADLYGADLRDADLYGADLRDADLYGADLHDADLYGADLRDADLYGADLRDADLWNVSGNRKEIKSIFISEKYSIVYTSKYLQIG